MQNYRMVVSYDGTRYKGWQRQSGTQQTIQGKLEAVLSRACDQEIEVHGSGRTDAGVHAAAQVAHFHFPVGWTTTELCDYLNRYLPEDIAVLSLSEAGPRFHARLNVVHKTYRYRIYIGRGKPVFDRAYVWTPPEEGRELCLSAMREAAALLCGEHDFAAFCTAHSRKKTTVRCLEQIRLEQEGDYLTLFFTGNGFLQNMVRILVGTLYEVGRGERAPQEVSRLLKEGERREAGFTAPAKGLTLWQVDYH